MNKSKESNLYNTKTSKLSIDFTFKPHGHTLSLFLVSSQTKALSLLSWPIHLMTLPIIFPKSMAEDPWPKTNKTNKEKKMETQKSLEVIPNDTNWRDVLSRNFEEITIDIVLNVASTMSGYSSAVMLS